MPYFNINRVLLVGRLTRDPELRSLPTGRSACELRVAWNSSHRDPDGERQERPNYVDVKTYGAQAETVCNHLHKGSRIGIDGRLEWREWETAEHGKRQALAIVAETIQFLDSPGERSEAEPGVDGVDGLRSGDDGAGELAGVGAGALDGELAF